MHPSGLKDRLRIYPITAFKGHKSSSGSNSKETVICNGTGLSQPATLKQQEYFLTLGGTLQTLKRV